MLKTPRQAATDRGRSGQALVEFALIMPILVVFIMGILEVALMFNAYVGVNRASQTGAYLASVYGKAPSADCEILYQIENDVSAPNDRAKIKWVSISLMSLTGNKPVTVSGVNVEQRYVRGGSITCSILDKTTSKTRTVTVPYQLTSNTYPWDQRCSIVYDGCLKMTPSRTTVDNVGVSIYYEHVWATPLNAVYDVFAGKKASWTFQQRNIFRMEPTM